MNVRFNKFSQLFRSLLRFNWKRKSWRKQLLAVAAGLSSWQMASREDILWRSAIRLISIYHEWWQGMGKKCKFVRQFLCPCCYSDTLDEVCSWIGQTVTQQEVDGKYEGVAAPAERFSLPSVTSHILIQPPSVLTMTMGVLGAQREGGEEEGGEVEEHTSSTHWCRSRCIFLKHQRSPSLQHRACVCAAR